MSLADEAIRLTGAAFSAVHADEWLILGTGALAGTKFRGDAQTESPVVLDSDVGSDAREKTMLYVDRTAPAIQRGFILSGKGAQWRVVGDVDDNPANYRIKFEVVKIVPGKDTP